jgi:hypothetical protein
LAAVEATAERRGAFVVRRVIIGLKSALDPPPLLDSPDGVD